MISERTEEVLFEIDMWEDGRVFPVSLITYENGGMDLHFQTGAKHYEALARANSILKDRGMKFSKAEMVGPSGVYYSVEKDSGV